MSLPSAALLVTIDTKVDAPINLDLIPPSDSGQSDQDDITNQTSPIIAGQAEAGTIVKLYRETALIGEATTDTSGRWQVATTALGNGTHRLTATATDAAGNVSAASSPLTIVVDAVQPTLSLTTSTTTSITQVSKLTGSVNGTGSAIASATYFFDGGVERSIVLDAAGRFDQAFDLTGIANGNRILTIVTTDVAGNVRTTQLNVRIAVDKEAPVITGNLVRDTAPDNQTNQDVITFDPTVSGTVRDANAIVEFQARFSNTAPWVNILAQRQTDGSFTLTRSQLDLINGAAVPDGTYTLQLQAKDEFGNVSRFGLGFTLDTIVEPPQNLQLTASSDTGISGSDRITQISTPTLTGVAEPKARVQLFEGTTLIGQATATDQGTWQITTNALSNGVHPLTAIATDIAGNVSVPSVAFVVIVDAVLPTLRLNQAIDTTPLTNGARLNGIIDGTGSAIAQILYRWTTGQPILISVDATGAFNQELDFTGIGNGAQTLTIVAIDVAGNISTHLFNVTVALDTDAPLGSATLLNDTAMGGTTNTDLVTSDSTITGALLDANQIVAFRASVDTATPSVNVLAAVDQQGRFTLDRARLEQILGGTLSDGAHTVYLQAVDQYNNVSQIFEVSFVLDTSLALSVTLDPAFDSTPVGDRQTIAAVVSLSGQAEAGAIVKLVQTGATAISDANGRFVFENVTLALGENAFTFEAEDIAGNRFTTPLSIKRLETNQAPTDILLSRDTIPENSAAGVLVGILSTIDPDTGDQHQYTLVDNSNGRFQLIGNELRVAPGAILDYETATSYTVKVRTTDNGKPNLFFDKVLTVRLSDINERPVFTSTPIINAEAGKPYSYTITTIDPENGDRVISAENLPSWLTLTDNGDGTATLSGKPTGNQTGLYSIDLAVTDIGGLTSTQTYLLGVDLMLREGSRFRTSESVTFTIDRPKLLSFTIDPSFDTAKNFINDAFEVALVDAKGRSLVPAIAIDREVFFNWTEGESVALGAGATYNSASKTVTLNLSGIPKNTEATLVFRLVNDDQDTETQVRIRNLQLIDPPAGTLPPVIGYSGATNPILPVVPNFNVLEDVSSSMTVEYDQTSYDAAKKLLYAKIAVKHTGTYSVDVPLLVAVSRLSDPSVLVRNPDGFTPEGLPYYDFSHLVADGKFDPSEITSDRSLVFYNPNGVQFTYELVVLAQLNQKPVIESEPILETIAGKPYRYAVQASDPNRDVLSYRLLSAPEGMTINAQSGVIDWTPAAATQSIHTIIVQVSDGRGGIAEQNFTLAVTAAPPNRPPLITSTPVVDAQLRRVQAGRIIVANDEWTLSDSGFGSAPDDTKRFVENVANYFTGGKSGRFLGYSNNFGITGLPLAQAFQAAGHQLITTTVIDFKLETLRQYDGVFVGGFRADNRVLIDYVKSGGNVYLFAGTGTIGTSADEAKAWEALLNEFGLQYNSAYNGLGGVIPIDATPHPIFDNINQLYQWNGNSIVDLNIADDRGVIVARSQSGQGLYAIYDASFSAAGVYKYDVNAIDADQDDLTYSLVSAPDGMWIDPTSGVIRWFPNASQVGPNPVTVRVIDGKGGSTEQSFKVLVKPEAGNHDPIIITDPITQAYSTKSYSYKVKALDADNDPVIYSLLNRPTGMTIDSSTGQISWEAPNVGSHKVAVLVEDGRGGVTRQEFDLVVSNTVAPGEIRGTVWNDQNQDGARGSNEKGLAGIEIYLDLNNNGIFDLGELTTRTASDDLSTLGIDEAGSYRFENLTAGTYVVREKVPAGLIVTYPAGRMLLGQNLARNGSFEQGWGTSWWYVANAGTNYISDWDILLSSVDYCSDGLWDASDGRMSIDLDGTPGPGAIAQSFDTVPGQEYLVTFDLSAHGYLTAGDTRPMLISAAGQSREFTATAGGGTRNMQYQRQTWRFTAISNRSTLQFTSTRGDSYGPVLDNVSVQPIVLLNDSSHIVNLNAAQIIENINFGNYKNDLPTNRDPKFNSVPPLLATAGELFQYQSLAVDPDFDSLNYELLVNPDGMVIDSATGKIFWQPSPGQLTQSNDIYLGDGTYNVLLKVQDNKGGIDLQSFKVVLQRGNQAPVFTSIAPTNAATQIGKSFVYQAVAFDLDSDALTFSLDAGLQGLSIDAQTGLLFWKPTSSQSPGLYDIAIRVTDAKGASATQSLKVALQAAENQSPFIVSTPETQFYNSSYTYQVRAIDANNDTLTYSLIDRPDGMVIDSTTGKIVWMPQNTSSNQTSVRVQVQDGRGGEDVQAFTLNRVINTGEIRGRVWEDNNKNALIDAVELGLTNIEVYLDQNDNGVYDLGEAVTQANKTGSYRFSNLQAGTYTVREKLPNGFSYSYPASQRILGNNLIVNGSFEQVAQLDRLRSAGYGYVTIGGSSSTDIVGWQTIGGPNNTNSIDLQYSSFWNASDGQVSIDMIGVPGPGRIEQTFATVPGETYQVTFDLGANCDIPGQEVRSLVVSAAGQSQRFNGISSGVSRRIDYQRLSWTFTANQTQTTLSFFTEYVDFYGWGPTLDNVSVRPILGTSDSFHRVQVAEGQLVEDLNFGNVRNADAPVNLSPEFITTPSTNVAAGNVFRYEATAIDSNADSLAYELLVGPIGMSIDSQTGVLVWKPTLADANELTSIRGERGVHSIIIRANDQRGGTTLQSFQIKVSSVNQAPIITSTPRTTARIGSAYFYNVEASDAERDTLVYTLDATSISLGMTLTDGILSWTPTAAQAGNHSISISVSDGKATTTQTYTLLVASQAINRAPVITSAPNLTTNLEQAYGYDLSGTDADGDPVLWSLEQRPEGMIINPKTGALRWQPTATQIGEHTVAVRLIDSAGLYTVQEFTLTVTGTNAPPMILSVPITRASQNQSYGYTAVASDPENTALTFGLGRRPNGMTIDTQTGKLLWTPTGSQLGSHTIDVQVTDAQGATTTQTFDIVVGTTAINQAPNITSTPVFMANPQTGYRYEVKASDPDGNPLTYKLLKAPTGMTISAAGVVSWNQPLNGIYDVIVGVEDGSTGMAQGFKLTVRSNRAPEIRSVAPASVTLGTPYRYDVQAIDGDGDALSYRLDEASIARGMTIDDRGRMTWTSQQPGEYSVTITVTDAQGATTQEIVPLRVERDAIAPSVQLMGSTDLGEPGSTITLYARATDNQRVEDLVLTVNGQRVLLDANGQATVKLGAAGTQLVAIASATDAAGNQGFSQQVTIESVDFTAEFNPVFGLNLGSLTDEFITNRTPIRGSVGGEGFARYELAIAPLGSDQFKTIATGNTAISNGTLGTLDPSLLQNDAYTVRLIVYGTNGTNTYTEETINVAGELKLGNFRLSFTDLAVPVTGIPISLTRTYDTLTSSQSDDFGYGWRMEFRDTDLRTSVRKRSEEEELLDRYPAFDDRTKVFITLPGGKREAFSFKAKQVTQIDGVPLGMFASYFYEPTFIAEKGNTSKLTIEFNGYIRPDANGRYIGQQGQPFNPADTLFGSVYVLTTKDGTQYRIDAKTGDLLTVRDTNGNTLTYTDDAITSSTGQKVTFERDARGRIVSVKDPMQEYVRYEYDDNGDLVSVSDREKNVTRLVYDTSYDDPNFVGTDDPGRIKRSHFLREIIDPLNRTGARSEYDENGRLKQIVDANGKAVEMTYDLNNDRQVVKDQLGNETIYVYDDRGNVLTEIDAEGNITQRQYNEDNWVTEETIISDRSDDPTTSGKEGFTTKYTYDAKGNKLTETNHLNQTTYYTYGDKGRLLSETDALGRTTLNQYDSSGNLTQTKDAKGQISSYSYDSFGLLKGLTDANLKATSFSYDDRGNVSQVKDAQGNITDYTYNPRGDKLTETRYRKKADGTVEALLTLWTYDSEGRVKTMTDAEQNRSVYGYDKLGRQVWVLDARGYLNESKYNEKGELEASLSSDGTKYRYDEANDQLIVLEAGTLSRRQVTYVYDDAGRKISETDALNRTTRYLYDKVGRLTQVLLPDATSNNWDDNPFTKTEYYTDGLVKAQIDERGNRTEFRYDSVGRQIEIIAPDKTLNDLSDNPRTRYEYDQAGQQKAVIDALNRRTEYQYDDLGRLKKSIFADQTFVETEYDKLGRRTASIDQNGKRTEYEYDALGRLIGVKNALNDWTRYSYNEMGNLTTVTDAEQRTTRYEYDKLGRRTATILPLDQRSTMTYDAIGNVAAVTDFNGRTTTYQYDAFNWLTEKRFQDSSSVAYTYTLNGQRDTIVFKSAMGQATEAYGWDYDERDRLTKRTDILGTGSNQTTRAIEYGYDIASNKTWVKTASGTTTYTYDERNRLDVVRQNGLLQADYEYDAVSNLIRTKLGNGTEEARQYDLLNRLTDLENRKLTAGGTVESVISKFSYTLDKVGNRTKITEQSGRSLFYTYDDLYRLTKEVIDEPGGTIDDRTIEYNYDKVGNRLWKKETLSSGTTQTDYQYDKNDRLEWEKVGGATTSSYTYDANGSTLTKTENGNTTTYVWNDDKRLIAATIRNANGDIEQQLQYRYNDDGIRVSSTANGQETRFLLDEVQPYAQVLEEYTPNGTVAVSYVYGNDLISQTQEGQTTYYHVDGLGSTTELTDTTGTVVSRSRYDAFGNGVKGEGAIANKYLFAGEQFDSSLGDVRR
ncbi:MAG: choice-of-anchor C family protein [Leptolyngbya sp. Prado105]|nr:choice-of-anchor C family protein [Leptolyngbya sp. Prado105]